MMVLHKKLAGGGLLLKPPAIRGVFNMPFYTINNREIIIDIGHLLISLRCLARLLQCMLKEIFGKNYLNLLSIE